MTCQDNRSIRGTLSRLGLRVIFLALAVALALGCLLVYQKAERVRDQLANLRTDIGVARAAMPTNPLALRDPSRVNELHTAVEQVCLDIELLNDEASVIGHIQPLLLQAGHDGVRLAQVKPLLDLGQTICDVGTRRSREFSDLAHTLGEQRVQRMDSVGPVLLDVVGGFEERLTDYRADLERIQAARAAIDHDALDGWLEPAAMPIAQLDTALRVAQHALDQAEPILPAARGLLGAHRPRTYIVMGQNSHELRATGGFTSGIGVIVIDQGRLISSEFRYSYDWDAPSATRVLPPEPYQRYLGIGTLFLRDANWWPDFPTTARQVQRLWALHQGGHVDGIIAIDEDAVQRILAVTGPVDLPQWGLQVGADDFYTQTKGRASTNNIKSHLIPTLYRGVFQKILSLESEKIPDLIQILNDLFIQKHMQAYLFDRTEALILSRYSLDGSIKSLDGGDYMFIVDTTVTYSEVSQLIEKSADLSVVIDANGALAERVLTLRYRNHYSRELPEWERREGEGSAIWNPAKRQVVREVPGYWGNWLRVYLPADSELVQSEGFASDIQITSESGKRLIAGFVEVRPGQDVTITLRYRGPTGTTVCSVEYPLLLQKQAGARPYLINLHLTTSSADCGEAHQQLDLRRDELVRLSLPSVK